MKSSGFIRNNRCELGSYPLHETLSRRSTSGLLSRRAAIPRVPAVYLHVASATRLCCTGNMETAMNDILEPIFRRRAVKVFDPVEIPQEVREQILNAARHAPSSFNMQPYRFYWVQSPAKRKTVAKLCMGQKPAETATALVVAVSDIGSMHATSRGQVEWMRKSGFSDEKIRDYERTAKVGRIIFMPGPFGIFGGLKWSIFRLVNLWKTFGMPPVSRQGIFKWAAKGTSLACQNLMIAAEALGLHSCPMEGFDGRRLAKFLGLSSRHHEIVMVIAIGRKSCDYSETPQWRRPFEATVTVL
jgi:nitroreductase